MNEMGIRGLIGDEEKREIMAFHLVKIAWRNDVQASTSARRLAEDAVEQVDALLDELAKPHGETNES